MSDDLTTSNEEVNDSTLDDAELEFTTREEYINCAAVAINAIADLDLYMEADKKRKARIMRKCLRILDDMVGEMYSELNEDDDNE